MGKLSDLFGLIMPNGMRDKPAAPSAPAQIVGAHNAPQLCMLPVDAPELILPTGKRMPDLSQLGERRVVQCKVDGLRALYVNGTIISRQGAPLDCALHCQPGLARIEKAAGFGPLVFDGEYVANDGFNATLAEHKRGQGEGVFWIFDMMPLVDWQSGRCSMGLTDRLDIMRDVVCENSDSLFVGALDHWLLDPAETVAKANEIWAAGGEGVVSKRANGAYIRNRSDDWVRIKQVHTVDGVIVDMAARKDGTLKHMMVRVDEEMIVVGTGWSKSEGITMLKQFSAPGMGTRPNSWVEIAFQRTTGASRSIRGAKFIRARDSKGSAA